MVLPIPSHRGRVELTSENRLYASHRRSRPERCRLRLTGEHRTVRLGPAVTGHRRRGTDGGALTVNRKSQLTQLTRDRANR